MSLQTRLQQGLDAHRRGDFEQARQCYQQVLDQSPGHSDALHLAGLLAKQCGAPKKALELVNLAIKSNAGVASFHASRGGILSEIGAPDAARESLQTALSLAPDEASHWFNLGNIERRAECLDAAERAYLQALKLKPGDAAALINLGETRYHAADFRRAVESLELAVAQAPQNPAAWLNLAHCQRWSGQSAAAEAAYGQVLALLPDSIDARYGRSLLALQDGNFEQGWNDFGLRFHEGNAVSRRHTALPEWDGRSAGTVLLWAEQGLGDEIMYAGLLPEVIARHGHCLLECDERLCPVFSRSFPQLPVVAKGATVQADWGLPLASLPGLLGFPDTRPQQGWLRSKTVPADLGSGPFKLGLSWRSANPHTGRLRSIPLRQFADLFQLPGIEIYSLQFGDYDDEAAATGLSLERVDGLNYDKDIEGLADHIAQLDAVLSIDNSVAHLTAALGKPTLCMLPFFAEWRWGRQGDSTAWYPDMRLLRQATPGDWSSVLEAACRHVLAMRGVGGE